MICPSCAVPSLQGTEIRATMWHEMAEEWHAKLQQGKVRGG